MAVASSSTVLDVPTLVSQLMAVERQPIDKLNTQISSYQTKISTFGTLSGLVSSFQTAVQGLNASLQNYSATASDSSVFSASAASTASAGTYSLSVSKLAQAQNLVAAGQASDSSAISSTASTVTFTVGGTSTDVQIAAGATLQDIRTAINAANLGVTATIVNDGSGTPYRLALTANATGASNAISSITVQAGGDTSINSLLAYNPTANPPASFTMTQSVAAQDAAFTLNGIAITSASNTVGNAIQGVTITLKNTTATPATLTVARDTGAINTAASGFVDAYNALTSQLRSRSAYGSATSAAPALAGDGTVRLMLDQLRGIFTTPASGGTLTYLSQVGITSRTDGSLTLDSSKLNSAMASNFSDVSNLFSSASGFATRLDAWATSVVQAGGLIDTRTKSLNTSIQGYNDQISRLEVRMTALQKQYTTTYSNLNMLLSNMNATSAYLTSQFSKGTSA
ncbi:MAG: flagellar filament capping protein FliD [Sulfuricella sp.]|jgi:flagellar hook-associated protein 2|nr:flagellar filament capping protein FliD [Sulfuricella sp.]